MKENKIDIRTLSRTDLEIIRVVIQEPGLTNFEISERVESVGRARINVRTKLLCEGGILARTIRQGTEARSRPTYLLYISPNAPMKKLDEAFSQLSERQSKKALKRPELKAEPESELMSLADLLRQSVAEGHRIADVAAHHTARIDALEKGRLYQYQLFESFPVFNPDWKDSMQEAWMKAFVSLCQMATIMSQSQPKPPG